MSGGSRLTDDAMLEFDCVLDGVEGVLELSTGVEGVESVELF